MELTADVKKTQEILGQHIKRPTLSEKNLSRPPFRFIHDIVTNTISTTGYLKDVFLEEELNSANITSRENKTAFLEKLISSITETNGEAVDVKISKILAGQDVKKTNLLLQALGTAIGKWKKENNANNDQAKNSTNEKPISTAKTTAKSTSETHKPLTKGAKKGKNESSINKNPVKASRSRSNEKSTSNKPSSESLAKPERKASKTNEIGKPMKKGTKPVEKEKTRSTKESHADENNEENHDADLNKPVNEEFDRNQPVSQDSSAHDLQQENVDVQNEDQKFYPESVPSQASLGKNEGSTTDVNAVPNSSLNKTEELPIDTNAGVNRSPSKNEALPIDANPGPNRSLGSPPTAAPALIKDGADVAENKAENVAAENLQAADSKISIENSQHDENLAGSDFAKSRTTLDSVSSLNISDSRGSSARPMSARRAPPRTKSAMMKEIEESSYRPSTGKVANILMDLDEDKDNQNYVVHEVSSTPTGAVSRPTELGNVDETPELGLRLEEEIDQTVVNEDVETLPKDQRGLLVDQILEAQRELENKGGGATQTFPVEKDDTKFNKASVQEINVLKGLIQMTARSANPLGKLLEFIREDVDSMSRELSKWREESRRLDQELENSKRETEASLLPLKQKLKQIEEDICNKNDAIAATKMTILRQEDRMRKILFGLDRIKSGHGRSLDSLIPSRDEIMRLMERNVITSSYGTGYDPKNEDLVPTFSFQNTSNFGKVTSANNSHDSFSSFKFNKISDERDSFQFGSNNNEEEDDLDDTFSYARLNLDSLGANIESRSQNVVGPKTFKNIQSVDDFNPWDEAKD